VKALSSGLLFAGEELVDVIVDPLSFTLIGGRALVADVSAEERGCRRPTCLAEHGVEFAATSADEGTTLLCFLPAGSFSDQPDWGGRRA